MKFENHDLGYANRKESQRNESAIHCKYLTNDNNEVMILTPRNLQFINY